MLASGETDDTTNNAAEALNSQFGKFALSGVTSYAQMLTRTYEFHIEYTESCAEKRQNDKMNKRSEKINKKIEARIKKIKSFRKLPREEQNKVFISHLQLLKLAPITNQKASQESSDESETGSEHSSETGSMWIGYCTVHRLFICQNNQKIKKNKKNNSPYFLLKNSIWADL